MKLHLATALTLSFVFHGCHASKPEDAGNGNGPPAFLSDDELPPGLRDNPGQALNAQFKPDNGVKFQKVPKGKNKLKMRDLDGKPLDLDMDKAERINPFSPDVYEESEDGTRVVNKETGEEIFLGSFFYRDGDVDVSFHMNEADEVVFVRVEERVEDPPADSEEASGRAAPRAQNFQRASEEVLIGFFDDDLDLPSFQSSSDNMETFLEMIQTQVEEGEEQGADPTPNRVGPGQRKLLPIYSTRTLYSRTCTEWWQVDIGFVFDDQWAILYPSWLGDFVWYYVFDGARRLYWDYVCVEIRDRGHYQTDDRYNSVDLEDRDSGLAAAFGLYFYLYRRTSSVNNRADLWYLISGLTFTGGETGWSAQNSCSRYPNLGGSIGAGFSSVYRLLSVALAHEIGHNLYADTLPFCQSGCNLFVMEETIGTAIYGFTRVQSIPAIQNALRQHWECGHV